MAAYSRELITDRLRGFVRIIVVVSFIVASAVALLSSSDYAQANHYFLRFPWWNGHPGCITQGYNQGTHTGVNKYALDTDIENGGPGCLGGGDVSAAAGGIVVFVRTSMPCSVTGDYGNYVDVQHTDRSGNVRYARYAHLSSVSVGNGTTVLQGQKIGVEGDTGYTYVSQQQPCSVHLHFRLTSTQSCADANCAVVPEPMSGQTGFVNGQIWTSDNVACVVGSGQWSSWAALGGPWASAPSAASWGCGRVDVFLLGTDNAIWQRWWDGSTWNVAYHGGPFTSAPAVVAPDFNRLYVFARGTDGALYYKWYDGMQWQPTGTWQGLGGTLKSESALTGGPSAASWGSNYVDVYVRWTDNTLRHKWWNGTTWSSWQSLGGNIVSGPGATSFGVNRVDVFYRGTNNGLWHRWWDGVQWSPLENTDPTLPLTSQPAVASWGWNRLDVFARASDSALKTKPWNGFYWEPWYNLYGTLASGPGAASQGFYRLDVFIRGTDGQLYHIWR
jgi:hypothetical protein